MAACLRRGRRTPRLRGASSACGSSALGVGVGVGLGRGLLGVGLRLLGGGLLGGGLVGALRGVGGGGVLALAVGGLVVLGGHLTLPDPAWPRNMRVGANSPSLWPTIASLM